MTLHDKSGSIDIAEHIERLRRLDAALGDDPGPTGMDGEAMFGAAPRLIDRQPGDHEAHVYLARKRADEAEARLARVHWWLTVALLFTLIAGVTLAVAAYADPVARLAHDTARSEYCGAC